VGGNFRLDALQAAVLLVKLKYLDTWTAQRRKNAAYYNSLFKESGVVEKGFISPPRAVWEDKTQELAANYHSAARATVAAKRKKDNSKNTHISHPTSHIVSHIYNQYVIRAERRDELRTYLLEQGIGTEIYYPLPLHLQECFTNLGYHQDDFPESKRAAAETLALPIYPELSHSQLNYVVEKISSFYMGNQ
jgi:dTDP-4-amino-4,6-dideoxygalactose transaminase